MIGTTKELVLNIENKPGTLAKVAESLGRENVNILGFLCQAQGKTGTARFIVSDPARAETVLKTAGFNPTVHNVITAHVPNKPGELGRFSQRLAQSGVNIEASFPVASTGGTDIEICFCVDNIESARKALGG